MTEGSADADPDPLAQMTARAEAYATIWRAAIDRNAAGAYKPEDWFDDVNRALVMAAEDAARTFAALVDAVGARSANAAQPDDPAGNEDSSARG